MSIQGPSEPPRGSSEIQLYKDEYQHGVDLFQRALTEYKTADEVHKKEAFRHVMDKALQVLNETAQGMKRQDLLEQNQKIATDFQTYQHNPSTEAEQQLKQDLDLASKKL
jgi:hypothetical protein